MGLSRTLVRVSVIGGLLLGAGLVIAGPARLSALWRQTTDNINDVIDRQITDPVAVRAQLRNLEGQYPKRIAQVRSDLSELNSQITALQREQAVTSRVVDMTTSDLAALTDLIDKAEYASFTTVADNAGRPRRVEVQWQGSVMTLDEVERRAADVNNTREAYAGRMGDIERDLGYMTKQQERLAALLTKLEREQADFQVQLWQLDRQVDSISRNERMITVLKARQESIEQASRYQVGSLEGLRGKLADIRAKQEGELASLGTAEQRSDYETKAKIDLDKTLVRTRQEPTAKKAVDVIRITPDSPAAPKPAVPAAGGTAAAPSVSGEKSGA